MPRVCRASAGSRTDEGPRRGRAGLRFAPVAAMEVFTLIHDGLKDPPAAFKEPHARLGAMALALGPKAGLKFLASLAY